MSWTYLFFAGLFEIGWAIGLKYTQGFTRLTPSLLTIASMIASLGLLGLALKELPVGTAYAIWTGIGTVGTALLGILTVRRAGDRSPARLRRADRLGHRRPQAGGLRPAVQRCHSTGVSRVCAAAS